jgi:hypothetical protein
MAPVVGTASHTATVAHIIPESPRKKITGISAPAAGTATVKAAQAATMKPQMTPRAVLALGSIGSPASWTLTRACSPSMLIAVQLDNDLPWRRC